MLSKEIKTITFNTETYVREYSKEKNINDKEKRALIYQELTLLEKILEKEESAHSSIVII